MKTYDSISQLKNIKNCVLTIGNFDGVHAGHQAIFSAARDISSQVAAETVVMTFEPHPVALLYPQKAPAILTPLPFKKYLLEREKMDNLLILKDSLDLLQMSPASFVDKFLSKYIKPSVIVEGETFNFGKDRSGTIQTLAELGNQKGFRVSIVPQKEVILNDGKKIKVSSSQIRELLNKGNASDAAVALGRPYKLIGPVVSGKGKGTQLGFPTLNMGQVNQLIPAEGVYAGLVAVGNTFEEAMVSQEKFKSVYSIGFSKTFGTAHPLLIEAHLFLEKQQSISAKYMALDFIGYIRPQQKFASESDLAAQIAKDCKTAKEMLNSRNEK